MERCIRTVDTIAVPIHSPLSASVIISIEEHLSPPVSPVPRPRLALWGLVPAHAHKHKPTDRYQ